MKMSGNTILITGGTSGIGQGLAEAFHQRGNQVIITGRREERLQEICERHAGMGCFVLDVTSPEAIRKVAARAIAEFPGLNCVINNSGVQMRVNFGPDQLLDDQALQAEVGTNLLGPIRLTAAFLPHLAARPDATLVNVSSGLAFVPMVRFPVYCATKAALHSWTLSLREQLRATGVQVIEIIPPWVATELGGMANSEVNTSSSNGRGPMALDAFIEETMKELESGGEEAAVGGAKWLMAATSPGEVKKAFQSLNAW
jgi:uncharacterized oxidoreductase